MSSEDSIRSTKRLQEPFAGQFPTDYIAHSGRPQPNNWVYHVLAPLDPDSPSGLNNVRWETLATYDSGVFQLSGVQFEPLEGSDYPTAAVDPHGLEQLERSLRRLLDIAKLPGLGIALEAMNEVRETLDEIYEHYLELARYTPLPEVKSIPATIVGVVREESKGP